MKIALVCDWLTGMRGGERCFEVACELFPDADIYTLVHFPGSVSKTIESHRIFTSFIHRLPGHIQHFRRYLPFFSLFIEQFNLNDYDCVLSFSHCVAKNVKTAPMKPHICYCHSPMRYAWDMRKEYMESLGLLKKIGAGAILNYLKSQDRKKSSRVTHFIANSINVQNRIKACYNRDSIVIYPPVDCSRFSLSTQNEGYYLAVSALVPYKRLDIAVEAIKHTSKKLVILGHGPELNKLKKEASTNIIFIENASDSEVAEYMQKCNALLFPGVEDFGIVPLEAQACGKPVIAFAQGGALETVVGLNSSCCPDLATGVFFDKQTPEALGDAIEFFEQNRDAIDPVNCRNNALKFDRRHFRDKLFKYISETINP